MKKIVLTLATAMVFSWQQWGFAGSSVDALIQKLEDKGILNQEDAAQLKDEVSNNEKTNEEATFKSLLPDWLNTMKLTGDFRLRDHYQRIDVPAGTANQKAGYNRGRLRARLNVEDQINDKIKVIFGIATSGENSAGAGNPRSNNLTFGGNNNPSENSFNKSTVVLNKAYAVYTPTSFLTLEGGKMDNPVWEPVGGNSQLLWDPNITPEGGAILLQKKINDYITPFVNSDFFVIADASPSVGSATAFKTDPYIYVEQGGIKGNLTEKLYYKAAVSYYGVNNPDRSVFGNRPSSTTSTSPTYNTNSTSGNGTQYIYGYYLIGGAVDMGINDPFGELLPAPLYVPQIGIVGQYFKNQGAPSSAGDQAWEMGAYMGSSQLNGWGTWKLTSVYKVLERNAWLDIFPDQDDYNGATDTSGYRTELDIGLAKNTWLTLTYYDVNVFKNISALSYTGSGPSALTAFSAPGREHLYQIDLNFKF